MDVSMIWTSIAVSLMCIGPVAWLFYKGYAMEQKLNNQLKKLEKNNDWNFSQSEINNGNRICAIDYNNKVIAMVRVVRGEAVVKYALLLDVIELNYAAGGINEEDEPCELIILTEHGITPFVFYQPGVDASIKFRELEQYGKRWFNQAQKVAVKVNRVSRPAKMTVAV